MTGAGAVQSASTVGFETLYAGYRYDGTMPQMYYVRNRFLLPMIGTWNKRDPLGYVDGTNLYQYLKNLPLHETDPSGNQQSTGAIGAVQRYLETVKDIPKECREKLENLPLGVCPIVIFAGHFVDPNPNLDHGFLLIQMDEIYNWYNEFEESIEGHLPPDWYIGGTGCFHEEIYSHLNEHFEGHVLNRRSMIATLPNGETYKAGNKRLEEPYAPFTLAALLIEAQKKAKQLCRKKNCNEVRIVVCCSPHMKQAIEKVKDFWPNITDEQEKNVKQLCDLSARETGAAANVVRCADSKKSK